MGNKNLQTSEALVSRNLGKVHKFLLINHQASFMMNIIEQNCMRSIAVDRVLIISQIKHWSRV